MGSRARRSGRSSPKILILSASVGAGHLRAAEAVEAALAGIAPGASVTNQDCLTLTTAAFRKLYKQAYLDMVNRAPRVFGYFYDLLDRKRSPNRKSDRLRILVERMNMGSFFRLLRSHPWDLIVNTHFLPAEVVASLRRDGKLNTDHMTVTTDYETHRLWVTDPHAHYCTATEDGAAYLEYWGVAAERISVTGIPIHPIFSEKLPRAAMLKSQGIAGKKPVILQLAGGFGMGPIEEIYRGLLAVKNPLEIVVVAGRNEGARHRLEGIKPPRRHRAKVVGFTDAMHELMALADIVVSKPGGLTTSEALASGAAMAIVNPIPGQESRNSDFLLESGAAIKINTLATLPFRIGNLLARPKQLATLKRNARRSARPKAAFHVARLALHLARISGGSP